MHFIGIAIEPSPLNVGFGARPVDRTHTASGILRNTPLQASAILNMKCYICNRFVANIYDKMH